MLLSYYTILWEALLQLSVNNKIHLNTSRYRLGLVHLWIGDVTASICSGYRHIYSNINRLMNHEEFKLRGSLGPLSSQMIPKAPFTQSLHSSPNQLNSGVGFKGLPISHIGPYENLLKPIDKSSSKEFLRYTLNPRDLGVNSKKELSTNWQYPKQREEQSLYEAASLNSTSTTVARKNSETFRALTRPNIPFTNFSEHNREQRTSPNSFDRQGQEIRRNVSKYLAKCRSAFDPAEFQPIYTIQNKPLEKQDSNEATDEQGSFYSDLFSQKARDESNYYAPTFTKKTQMQFPQETMTPKFQKKYPEMEPKRNTNVMLNRNEQSMGSSPLLPSTANFKRMPQSSPVSSCYLRIEDFHLIKKIGQGRFGQVFFTRHRLTKTIYALKKINKKMVKGLKMEHQIVLEIKLQLYFNHPNVTKLYGFFDDAEFIYLVMEFMEEGTLYERMHQRKNKFTQIEVAVTTSEISQAIQALDDKFVAHRDIKPENILLSYGLAKLSDFGWSTICYNRRSTYCATYAYMSPEMLEGKDHDQTIDLWCLGVLIFELITGRVPFYSPSRKETERQILNADHEVLSWPESASHDVRDLVESLLKRDPNARLKATELLNHKFIKQVLDKEQ